MLFCYVVIEIECTHTIIYVTVMTWYAILKTKLRSHFLEAVQLGKKVFDENFRQFQDWSKNLISRTKTNNHHRTQNCHKIFVARLEK